MKRLLPLLLLTMLGLSTQQVEAQPMPFGIISASDSTWGPQCIAPAYIDYYMYGWANQFNAQTETVWCAFHYGDGTSDTVQAQLYGDFAGLNFFANGQHEYAAPGSYTVYYEVWGTASGVNYYDSLLVANEMVISDTCGQVSGRVYYDGNNNCVYDAGDIDMPNRPVALYTIGSSTIVDYDYTNTQGEYDFFAPLSANYEVRFLDESFNNVCPGYVQTVGTMPNTTIDYALFCDSTFYDLAGALQGWGFRPGFAGTLYLSLSNLGCLPQSGTATITLDPQVTYTGTCYPVGAVVVNGNTLTIDFAALSSGQWGGWFSMSVFTDPNAVLGTTACFNLSVSPTNGDSNPTNNNGTYCFPITNSWDPNDKAVSPSTGANGATLPNQEMTYTVRFQNTGTAEAFNVFILDTISNQLNIETFRVISASHPMEVFMLDGRTVKFNFANINLPDSGANEALSHGFVTYAIRQNPDLANGTVFNNTGHIYFDFNPAVVTNTAVSTIDLSIGVNDVEPITYINLMPNPATTTVQVKGLNGLTQLELTDAMGRLVQRTSLNSSNATIDISQMRMGTYTFRFTDADGVKVARLIKQ